MVARHRAGSKGRRTNLIAAGLLAVGLLGPALSTQVVGASSPVTAPANDGPELHWALANSPDTLFAPTYFSTPIGSSMMGLIQDNLLAYTGDGELVPSAASAWTATSPTTYVYTLRDDLKFSDGSPVTPEDVKFSIDQQSDPAVASKESALFENVKSVTVDGNDITVELKTPDSLWKYLPSHMGTYIYKQSDVEANRDSYGTPEHFPIGSGPYMVSEFVADSHVTMVPNPYYWGDPPAFSRLQFDVIPDDQTRLLALQQGDIDGTWDVPSASLSVWEDAATVYSAPSYVFRGLTLDMDQAPLNDIHVRRALYYATDREGIAEGLFPGQAVAANTLDAPELYAGILPDADVTAGYDAIATFPYDIDKAKEEMALSSVPDGFDITINVPEDSTASTTIMQAIQESWSQIGVNVDLNLMPGGPRFQLILDHGPDLGVQIIGNVPDVPDPMQLIALYYDSSQAATNGNNSSNFRDDTVDQMIADARQSTDPAEAATTALEIQQTAAEQVPIIPIMWSDLKYALRSDWTSAPVNGFSLSNNFLSAITPS